MTASGQDSAPRNSLRGSTRGTGEWHIYTAIYDERKSEMFVDGYCEASAKNVGNNKLDGLSIGCDHNGVFFLSGAIAGVASAVVSQPADVVLSRVAQGEGSSQLVGKLPGSVNQLALLQTSALSIWRQYGTGGFFLGLPSRCLWSGAIIAGQFFLYDVFKTALHVTAADLSLFYDALGTALS